MKYVLLIAAVAIFATVAVEGKNGENVTFECHCDAENATTHNCNCQTFVKHEGKKRRCFYDCSNSTQNYTCQINETCEKAIYCNKPGCHKNATCQLSERNDIYGYRCECNAKFCGNGTNCSPAPEPKKNCSCENKTFCCMFANNSCPDYCPNCKTEEACTRTHCFPGTDALTCWCNATCGREHGNFTSWSTWSNCSVICGVGEQTRTRNCTNPAPKNGGRDCVGNYTETKTCNLPACPIISFSASNYTGRENDSNVTVQVKVISGVVVENITISLLQFHGHSTAKVNEDYALPTREVTFTPKDAEPKNISIDLVQDGLVEGKEFFTIMFTANVNDDKACLNTAIVFIEDSDVANVSFEVNSYTVDEGKGPLNVTVILDGNLAVNVTANVITTSQSISSDTTTVALPGDDYTVVNESITFQPNGSKRIDVPITILKDSLIEHDEKFNVTLSSHSLPMLEVGSYGVASVTIKNDDMAQVKFERHHYVVNETDERVNVRVLLTANNLGIPVTFSLEISPNSTDLAFVSSNNNVYTGTFNVNGSREMNISIKIDNDHIVEENETFTVTLTSGISESLEVESPDKMNITILDNDVDGNFSSWTGWSNCSRRCGFGIQIRTRFCIPPQGEGKNCTRDDRETRSCNTNITCPGTYNCSSFWSNWTACNVTCGTGYQSRNRTWYNVVDNVRSCNGTDRQIKTCQMTPCQTSLQPTTNLPETTHPPDTTHTTHLPHTTRPSTTAPNTASSSTLVTTPTSVSPTVASNWLDWEECNVTCGDGNKTRRCSNNTGFGCNGTVIQSKPCSRPPCPVDGYFKDWSNWAQCSQTCGSGTTFRERECIQPLHGGKNCSEPTREEDVCTNPSLCKDEIGFSPWSEWSQCSVTCLDGIRTRERYCLPDVDNSTCTAARIGNKTCFASSCPVNGNWSGWGEWPTECPGTCGSSLQNRSRKCDNPAPQHGGANCTGPAEEFRECNHSKICNGESGFTDWSDWTLCSATCGKGVNQRTRECKPGSPATECDSVPSQEKQCYIEPCPVNGGWSEWQDWTRCNSSCGSGIRERKRTCSNPERTDGGLPCYGNDKEQKVCVMPEECNDDYAYDNWGSWSECSTTCGSGKKERMRTCKLVPKYPPEEKLLCESPSEDFEYISCFIEPCPIDGNFTGWSFWSLCSVTCGQGVRNRTRSCTHPLPMNAGRDCIGKRLDVEDCNTTTSCPDDKFCLPWTSWGNCSNTCEGTTTRTRSCNFENRTELMNRTKDCNTELCDRDGEWSEWTPWSNCNLKECGPQMEQRRRFCNDSAPQAAGNYCRGHDKEEVPCSGGDPWECDKKPQAGWTDWSWWKPCSKSCDSGVRSRHRKCSNPPLVPGGLNCTGNSTETEICNTHYCPVNGGFTDWSPWTNCTLPCRNSSEIPSRNGTKERNRSCTNPKPQHGGLDCDGDNFTKVFCNVYFCPIHGGFTPWSKYSFCSKPCNDGTQIRTRSCTNPRPMYGGRNCSCDNTEGQFSHSDCNDNLEDSKRCNEFTCPPVQVWAEITFNNSFMEFHYDLDRFKYNKRRYIVAPYGKVGQLNPVVGFDSCRVDGSDTTCVITVSYNFSDGDQLPILRDVLDSSPGSNVSLLWMNSSIVFAKGINITTNVSSSTSIQVNWSMAREDFENITSITVFYKILDDTTISFAWKASPASFQGSVMLENLEKFTRYKITVSATTANGTGIPSRFVTAMTLEDVPSKAPPNVVIVSPNPNELKITWHPMNKQYLHGIHRGYCLYYYENPVHLNDSTLEFTISGLRPYTKHYVQVAGKTTPGCGAKSQREPSFTEEDKPDAPPQNLIAYNVSSTELRVEWKEVEKEKQNGIIKGYDITYYVNTPMHTKHKVKVTSGTTISHVLSGLSVWTLYNVSVAAYTNVGLGPAASVLASTEEGAPPVAPEIVVAQNTSSSSIYVQWRGIGQGQYGILLGYQISYKALDYAIGKPVIKNLPLTARNYTMTGLFFYWNYDIKVGGYTRPGVGEVARRTVRTDEHLPGRSPENVEGEAETSTSIYVKWGKVASNFVHGILLGYNLTVRETKDLSKLTTYELVKEHEVYLTNLKKYTEYTIWVRAVNSKGHGKLNSPEGYQVRTKEDAPEVAPSNIRVVNTRGSISSLNLEWNRIPEDKANGIIRGYYVEYTAVVLNGQKIELEKQVTKTFRVRGNRYATIINDLIPGSTYHIKMFGYTIKNGTKSSIVIGETCKCPEYLKVNWWKIPPYTDGERLDPGGIFSRTVQMMLDMCGTCENGHGKTKACYSPGCDQQSSRKRRAVDTYQKESFQQVLDNINNNVDISFPIQGNKYTTHHGGVYPYISVVETSGSVYFTVKNIPSTAYVLIQAAFYSIPLLILITLLSFLAGIIIWALERSSNPTSFPLSFTKGLKEGFWWAFISASTVGYGDRRPVTIPGKLFAISWILVGYVIITLLTGLMVNSITLILVTQKTSIYGAKVAAVENSTEYGKAIRRNGDVKGFGNVDEVIKALKDKVVDGAVMDMYAAATRQDLFQSGDIELRRQIEYPAGYGIVLSGRMKDSAPMIKEYFKKKAQVLLEFIQNNTDIVTQKPNQAKERAEKKSGIFDATSGAYQLTIIVISSLLAASLLGGLFWQYNYHAKAVKIRNELRNSAPAYGYYENLREDVRDSCEGHFKHLMSKLRKTKKKHMKELKLLAKYYKESGRPWPVARSFTPASPSPSYSFTRIRKMTASVTPSLNSRHNIALEVLDIEGEYEKQHSKDSQV